MKWMIKSIIQNIISLSPDPSKLNYFFQKNITKRLPGGIEDFFTVSGYAVKHLRLFREYYDIKLISEARFYEFGAGWDLSIPLLYHALGINHQTIIDIRPNLRYELINDSINKLNSSNEQLTAINGESFRNIDNRLINGIDELEESYGIEYKSPVDAKNTGFADACYDFISNTLVLEHIPQNDIPGILNECYRILKPGGIFSCFIDLKDHYSELDRSITYYNFLKFPEWIWKLANTKVLYQNRLRFPDYLKIFDESIFEILEYDLTEPHEDDLKALEEMNLSEDYRKKYSTKELGIKLAWVVLRKP